MNIRNNAIKLMKEAKEYMKNRDYLGALKIIDEILMINPYDEHAKLSYASILFAMGENSKAKEIFLKLVNSENNEIKYNSMFYLGRMLNIKAKYTEAKPYFEKILKESKYKTIASCVELYKYYTKVEMNPQKGFEILEKYGDDSSIRIIFYKAEAKLKMGDIETSERIINQARRTSNYVTRRQINTIKGQIETKKGNYYKALELFDSVIMEDVKDNIHYEAVIEKAVLKKDFSLYDEAIELCETAVYNNEALRNRALSIENIVYMHCNNYEKAKEKSLQITKDNMNDYRYYLRVAKTEYYFKNYEEAIELYNKILKMDECPLSVRDISNYWCAMAKYKLGYGNPLNNIRKINDMSSLNSNEKYIGILKNTLLHSTNSYSSRQLEHYNIIDAINHIDRIHERSDSKSYFDRNIDISLLIDKVKTMVNDDNLTNNNLFETHQINYENIGYIDGISSNTLEVITLPSSNKILTMYPVLDKKIKDNYKLKQKSQIEKFYERYGKTS